MKTFLSIALAGVLATGFTTLVIADDTATTTTKQSETAPSWWLRCRLR